MTAAALHPPVTRELPADDIPWEAPADPIGADMLVEALRDAESYRLVAQEALQALAILTARHTRLVESHRDLRERYRALVGQGQP